MQKVLILAIVVGLGYASYQGKIFSPGKQSQSSEAADPLADLAARLKAEQERLHAEEDARGRNSQPIVTPAAAPASASRHFSDLRIPDSQQDDPCARARNNVQVTSDWMRQGGTVYEKNSRKILSHNEAFDAAARDRQFVKDNCRGR